MSLDPWPTLVPVEWCDLAINPIHDPASKLHQLVLKIDDLSKERGVVSAAFTTDRWWCLSL
jgi:hypothetical protein